MFGPPFPGTEDDGPLIIPTIYVQRPIQWQTRRIRFDAPPTEADLKPYGDEGWELVSVIAHYSGWLAYFKQQAG